MDFMCNDVNGFKHAYEAVVSLRLLIWFGVEYVDPVQIRHDEAALEVRVRLDT